MIVSQYYRISLIIIKNNEFNNLIVIAFVKLI